MRYSTITSSWVWTSTTGTDVNTDHASEQTSSIGIAQWVERQWTVTTIDDTAYTLGQLAINPATGLPYYIEHVDTNYTPDAFGGDGTFENPYPTLTEAQTMAPGVGPNNIIFVHAGSQFTAPFVLNPGETVFGEGVTHTVPIVGFNGLLDLPTTGKPGGLPNIDGIGGTAVTLADDVHFAGFTVSNTSGGPAILGDMITNARLRGIRIEDVNGGDGLVFRDSSGAILLDDVNILRANNADVFSGVDGDAFLVDGGDANIVYRNSTIENTLGRAVRIRDAAGSVDMSSTRVNSRFTVTTNGDEGVIVQDSSADVRFGQITLQNGSFELENISGNITVMEPMELFNSGAILTSIENPNAIPLRIDGSSGMVTFCSHGND